MRAPKGHRWPLGVVVALCAIAVVAVASGFTNRATRPAKTQADSISILSLWGGGEKAAFLKVTDAFTKKTGIKVSYETARDFVPVIRTRLAGGNPPDMAIVPRPGIVADLARQGVLHDLKDLGIDPGSVTKNYSSAWTKLTQVNGKYYGVVAKANSKSVVWYDPARFSQLKVQPAKTWSQLVALTNKIRGMGKTPWAVGGKDNWTLTDWFENVYARTAGVNKYNQLFTGKVPFDDPSVVTAIKTMTQIVNAQNVSGGVSGILGTAFTDGIGQVFSKKPKAEMYMEGGFVGGIALSDVNKALKPGKTIQEVPFPVITASNGNPLVGGGDIAVAFKKSDAVTQFMKFIASSEAGKTWVSTGAIVSPNKSVPPSAYPNVLVRAEAKQVANAKAFVFDGSDTLPGSLADTWGATLQNIVKSPDNAPSLLKSFQSTAKSAFANG